MTTFFKLSLVALTLAGASVSANATGNPYLAVHGINGVAYGK